jgi:flagellar protein FlaG
MIIDKLGSIPGSPPPTTGASLSDNGVSGAQTSLQPGAGGYSPATIEKATHAANRLMESFSSQIRFNVTNESGKIVVRMVDMQTKQVLLQIPNEQMVKIAQDPARLQGLALNQKA